MSTILRVLQIEDSESDAALIVRLLERSGYAVSAERVDDAVTMRAALNDGVWDVIIADYHVPQFEAPAALDLLHESALDIPFIVVSGVMGEDVAVAMMRAGAHDYLIKDHLARLAPAVEREIREAEVRAHRRRAEDALRIALAKAEEGRLLLDAVFTAQTDGVFVSDANGMVIRTNPAGAAVLGVDPAGMHFEDIAARLNLAAGMEGEERSGVLGGETILGLEHTMGDRVVETSSAPMRDSSGAITGAVTISRDITERKRAEESVRKAQKLESIGVLAGGIAHDFNNLLTTIGGNIALVLDDVCHPSEIKETLRAAMDSVDRGAVLTRQLLAYAGKGGFVRERVPVHEIAERSLELVRASLPQGIELKAELDPRLAPVLMDRGQMMQVFTNLIINGVEAIGAGATGVVTVRTISNGESFRIEISDDGCGVDHETQQRMFEPFFSTKFAGRGLGLAAVDGVVRSLGGRIVVDSGVGRGTRVVVEMPAGSSSQAGLKQ